MADTIQLDEEEAGILVKILREYRDTLIDDHLTELLQEK